MAVNYSYTNFTNELLKTGMQGDGGLRIGRAHYVMKRAAAPRFDVEGMVDGHEEVSIPLIRCYHQEYCANPNELMGISSA